MLLDSESSFLLANEREKKATSDPDIIADKNTRIAINKRVIPSWKLIG